MKRFFFCYITSIIHDSLQRSGDGGDSSSITQTNIMYYKLKCLMINYTYFLLFKQRVSEKGRLLLALIIFTYIYIIIFM